MNISLPQGRFPKSSRAQCRNRLRPLQISWEAMAELCRTLEERQSQVQLQDVRFSSAPPASDEDRQSEVCQRGGLQSAEASVTTSSTDSAVRTRAFLNYQVDTTRTESSDHWTTHVMGKEMRREARRRELEAKVFGHWSADRLFRHFAFIIYFLRSCMYSFSGVLLHVALFLASFDRATFSPSTWCWTFRIGDGKNTYIHTYMHACMHACMHTYTHTYIYIYICVYYMIYL